MTQFLEGTNPAFNKGGEVPTMDPAISSSLYENKHPATSQN